MERIAGGTVAAPLATRVLAGAMLAGVVGQAVLAGGFLEGRGGLRDVHELIGHALVLVGVLALVTGLVGRKARREPISMLATRVVLAIAVAGNVFLGMQVSQGARDLLMLHIPLAFLIMGLALHLFVQAAPPRDARLT